jgi:hypothetical protein
MIQKSEPPNPIEEIHQFRREISDRFSGNIAEIAADASRRARESGRLMWKPNTKINPSESLHKTSQNEEK